MPHGKLGEYFDLLHGTRRRDTATIPGKDFELLPKINGRGRFLGVNIGADLNVRYGRSWFGEGGENLPRRGLDYPTLKSVPEPKIISEVPGVRGNSSIRFRVVRRDCR